MTISNYEDHDTPGDERWRGGVYSTRMIKLELLAGHRHVFKLQSNFIYLYPINKKKWLRVHLTCVQGRPANKTTYCGYSDLSFNSPGKKEKKKLSRFYNISSLSKYVTMQYSHYQIRITYKDLSRPRPKGCAAQGVSTSGLILGARKELVEAAARDHTCGSTCKLNIRVTSIFVCVCVCVFQFKW